MRRGFSGSSTTHDQPSEREEDRRGARPSTAPHLARQRGRLGGADCAGIGEIRAVHGTRFGSSLPSPRVGFKRGYESSTHFDLPPRLALYLLPHDNKMLTPVSNGPAHRPACAARPLRRRGCAPRRGRPSRRRGSDRRACAASAAWPACCAGARPGRGRDAQFERIFKRFGIASRAELAARAIGDGLAGAAGSLSREPPRHANWSSTG